MEKELINNSQSNIYPFHMPGHKRRGSDIGAGLDPYAIDITEIDNFDNLHHAEGIIKEAQAEAAALYGAFLFSLSAMTFSTCRTSVSASLLASI